MLVEVKEGGLEIGIVEFVWDTESKGTELSSFLHNGVEEADGEDEGSPFVVWLDLLEEVLVHHGGQPMTMFKYACYKGGVDINKIKIIDAGNGGEMDKAYRAGTGQYIHQQGPAPQQLEADRVENWKPARQAVQDQSAPAPQPAPRIPKPDRKAQEWVAENDWFQKDTGMTRYAMLVHEELLESGVDSTSDVYYDKINEAMRSRYPDRFADVEPEVRQPQRKAGSVVAPGGRSTASSRNKVVITSSEAAIAKRLGISNKDYAAQKLKDMQNG